MEAKPFIELLRRTIKSKYKEIVMINRMMMQCYNIDEDSDVGLHYILHIPETEDYEDPFYDEAMLIVPADIITLYNEGHSVLLEKKKETGAKPKEVREELVFKKSGNHATIKFIFIAHDEIVDTKSYKFQYPISNTSKVVDNLVETYQNILDRVKIGGSAIVLDGFKYGLFDLALNSTQIVFFKIKIGEKKIKVPLYKSMLLGQKTFDNFFISVQETTLPAVYLYTIQFIRKEITEEFIGYIQNF